MSYRRIGHRFFSLAGFLILVLMIPRIEAEEARPVSQEAKFQVGQEVLVGTDGTNSIIVPGTISRVLGTDQYEVRFKQWSPGDAIRLSQRTVSGRVLHELNDPTQPVPGPLPGLRNIVLERNDPAFQSYVSAVAAIVERLKPDFSRSAAEVAGEQQNLIDEILAEQRKWVTSTRSINQKIRRLYDDRPVRTLGDIVKTREADTFDASTLLWAALYESGAVEKAGLRIQALKTLTPVNYEEIGLRVTYADGQSELVDPVWSPSRQPLATAAWPQETDSVISSIGSRKIVGVLGEKAPTGFPVGNWGKIPAGSATSLVDSPFLENIRSLMYDASKNPLVAIWDRKNIGIAEIAGVPGRVVWLSPSLSFPQLGIQAGVPPTAEQLGALARLLGIEIVYQGKGDGMAVFPTHVGRSVNPNPFALTVIGPGGEEIPDLVIKGVGRTERSRPGGGFNFPLRDAWLDADVSMNLLREGVRIYRPLLIFVPDESPDKAVYVRAPDSMLRHKDLQRLGDAELKATLDLLMENMARMTGGRKVTAREWARDFLPYMTGRNAGILAGLGVFHGSLSGTDNHGLAAETVDWDGFRLDRDAAAQQKSWFENTVANAVQRINSILPRGEQIDAGVALAAFGKGYSDGREFATRSGSGVAIHEGSLMKRSIGEIRWIFDVQGSFSDSNVLISSLKQQGKVKPGNLPGTISGTSGSAYYAGIPIAPQFLERMTLGILRFVRGRANNFGAGLSRRPGAGTSMLEALQVTEKKMTGEKIGRGRRLSGR